jgi:peptidoglycan hydrolase-like protein with peptidoglycan-binding domain
MATIGIDIASVDGNATPDWAAARQQGHLQFVGLRASEGLTPDTWYPTYRRQLDAIGVPHFPYLLLTANLDTPENQAQKALDVVGTLNSHYFPLALDVEGSRRGLTADQWLGWIIRAKRVIKETIGVSPLLYSSRTYWVDPAGLNNLPAPELTECLGWWKFWQLSPNSPASYDPPNIDQLPPPPVPPPWQTQFGIHQYQGDAIHYPGFKSTVDLNRLHVQRQGDVDDGVKWIQQRLPALIVDGVFGPKTASAVKTFQTKKKITADGIVGLETLQLLAWEPPRSIAP